MGKKSIGRERSSYTGGRACMFRTDFSRLGQLFYEEVGSEGKEATLPGFMRDACFTYQQRFICPGLLTEGVRRVEYPSDDKASRLSIYLVTSHYRPEITGVAMNGATNDLPSLFGLLRGTVQAEFSGIKLEDLTEQFEIDREEVEARKHTLAKSLGLYFSWDGKKHLLRRASPEKKAYRKLIFLRQVPIPLAEAALDEAAWQLLSRAERLKVANTIYRGNDIDRGLVHESCSITQPEAGKYYWDYALREANNEGIPAEMLPLLESLFSQLKPAFSQKSFQMIRNEERW